MNKNPRDFIAKKFNLAGDEKSPVVLKGIGRKGLYKLWAELGVRIGCEVGVQRGRNSYVLLNEIPDLLLYLVDPWSKHPYSSYYSDPKWNPKNYMKFKRQTRWRLSGKKVIIIEKFSEDAFNLFPDNFLDFVYIDGDHSYDFAMLDILLWSRKVKVGGIVSGHDYYLPKKTQPKVGNAVDDYTKIHKIQPVYLTDNRLLKPEKGDKFHSWMWIKK